MVYKQFYSELGKLIYAVADVDGIISKEEKRTLKELIRKELVPEEKHTDEFGTDAAYYAEFEFDIMEETHATPEAAFNSFTDFIENHHSAFDKRLQNATLKLVTTLANTYHKTSEKERKLIEKLRAVLEGLPVRKKKLKLFG